jgi:LacI family transcriptional regulator
MAASREHIRQLLVRRGDWTPIAVFTENIHFDLTRLLEVAEERRWRYIDLASTQGHVPPGESPQGALVRWLPTDPPMQDLLRRGIPAVRIGQWPHRHDGEPPAVIMDRAAAGRLAAEHLAERNFMDLGYVGHIPWGPDRAMYEAFVTRSGELGCRCHLLQEDQPKLRAQVTSKQDILTLRQAAFTSWLLRQAKPLGLFLFGDYAAALYCRWVIEAGLRVPEDVAVLSIGNHEFSCRSAAVPLSSIAFDHALITQTAADLLAQLMTGQAPDQTTVKVPPSGVITRQSTDVLAATDPAVVAALRFIWDHVTEDLAVSDVAKGVGVPQRSLQRAFQQDVGRSISQEIKRRRLEKARDLLLQADLRIAEVVDIMDFSSPTFFCRAFRLTYGSSPAKYRSEHSQNG